jgi:hypothetical protein
METRSSSPYMRYLHWSFLFGLGLSLAACQGDVGSVRDGDSGSGSGSGSGAGGSKGGGGSGEKLPDGTPVDALIPARIRRLTNAEYGKSAQALTGTSQVIGQDFAPDLRQSGYTVNEAQVVDPVLAKQYAAAADKLAAEVKTRVNELAPCADAAAGGEACATQFIDAWGAKAYRRPLDDAERAGLLKLYQVGSNGATYADGIELVVKGLLQSAGFIYLTELGDGSPGSVATLTPYELASSLSYGLTGGPPSAELLQVALAGGLSTGEGRAEQARLLLGPAAREKMVNLLREWIGIDRLTSTAKDTNVYPDFPNLKPAMVTETDTFINAVMMSGTPTVGELLSREYTPEDQGLAAFYSRGSGPPRRGLLNQGAFLSVYAHAHESAPVLRGVAVLRRVACLEVKSPTELNINVVPPVPDPSKSTRQRYAIHATDPECAACHNAIDAFGFSFEAFDGMGGYRTTDNGVPVDSSVTIDLGTDFDGTYKDSNELASAMAQAPSVQACFARNLFRAASGRSSGEEAQATEDQFLKFVESIEAAKQGNIVETVLAYVKSPLFAQRRNP